LIELDHLVVAARALEDGVAWVEARLGVTMGAGGKHALMSTHNRVLNLGGRRRRGERAGSRSTSRRWPSGSRSARR
jgi:hypothetical protein